MSNKVAPTAAMMADKMPTSKTSLPTSSFSYSLSDLDSLMCDELSMLQPEHPSLSSFIQPISHSLDQLRNMYQAGSCLLAFVVSLLFGVFVVWSSFLVLYSVFVCLLLYNFVVCCYVFLQALTCLPRCFTTLI